MPASDDSLTRLEVAHVLFMDIVGYSRLTIEDQSRRIATLQDIVRGTNAYTEANAAGPSLRIRQATVSRWRSSATRHSQRGARLR